MSSAPIWGCQGKEQFLTPEAASRVIRRQSRRRSLKRANVWTTLGPYRCKGCGHWHVGNGLGG